MERKLEILLVEDDAEACKDFADHIADCADMVLIGTTGDSAEAASYIRDYLPDVVILDLELHLGGGSGLFLLSDIQRQPPAKKPYILITTNNTSAFTYESVRRLGGDYIMSKHQGDYSTEGVLDFLRIMSPTIMSSHLSSSARGNTTETPIQHEKRLRKQITLELDHVGITPKAVGYRYLAEAILIMIENPTHKICAIIADKFSKSEPSVERAMQNAINRAWKTSSIEDLLRHYTAPIHSEKGNPTVTEFICYYANKLKNEY